MINKISLLHTVSAITLSLLLGACGGGSGGGINSPPPPGTGTISGSVSGTIIIAVNSNGDIVATDDTAGRTRDVDTDGNGSLDAFSFTLNSLPLSEDIRVFLVTLGRIVPMYFDSNNDGMSDSNVFTLSSGSNVQIALGFISTIIGAGRAIPSSSPTDNSAVAGNGTIIEIPVNINEPPTTGLTVAELNTKGEAALGSGWVLGAKTYYQSAVNLAANSSGNDADTARFMLAITRVAALGFDTLSDGSAQDMGRLGDLLDLFGVADNGNRANWLLIKQPVALPTNSPTGNNLRDFNYDVIRPELQAAALNFDAVSTGFDTTYITENGGLINITRNPFSRFDFNGISSTTINVDHGDALFFKGYIRSLIANIELQRAYNLNVDIDIAKNNDQTIENVKATNTGLLGQPDLTKLAEAKATISTALANIKSAIEFVEAESDDQIDDLTTIDASVNTMEIKTWIDETLASINGSATNIGTASIDLQMFFNSGVVLDDTTLPGIAGNNVDPTDGFFDDPTMGNVILDIDNAPGIQSLNEDLNSDGTADILQ